MPTAKSPGGIRDPCNRTTSAPATTGMASMSGQKTAFQSLSHVFVPWPISLRLARSSGLRRTTYTRWMMSPTATTMM